MASPPTDGTVRVVEGERGTTVVLDRPARRNALTLPMWRQLAEVVADQGGPQDPVGGERPDALVITGAGGYFCSGADLDTLAWAREDPAHAAEFVDAVVTALLTIHVSSRPVVALVEGGAAGGGVEIMAACDSRVALGAPTLVFPFGRHGMTLDDFTRWRLDLLVGSSTAQRLVDGHHVVGAEEARELGLFDGSPPDAALPTSSGPAVGLALDRSHPGDGRGDATGRGTDDATGRGTDDATGAPAYLRPGETLAGAARRAGAPMLAALQTGPP
ncbi:enoyl-CoA hydratase/isomerase family protein [Serinicoccus profundi]|uniref:enoyl-CoA hydratase/isomerase family protein n=2 Tax=Serinicoccus profundi TaxID=1078471 RepID=UPI0011CA225F|nr:enoyl-CoA hydratase/isomerase family protein [Serinicoccus profundi]